MKVCPVCEYPRCVAKWRLPDRFFQTTRETFELYECPSCGLLFHEPGPEGVRADWYPSSYWFAERGGWLERCEAGYRRWVVRRDHLRFLQELFPNPAGLRLLDVGAGTGLFVSLARAAGFTAEGVDPSAPEVPGGTPGLVRRATVEELLETGYRCDIVTLFHVLEHVPDPFRFLRRVRGLLEQPGHLIVQVPNRASWQARCFGARWYGLDCPRHVCNFTEYALLHVLGRAGFRIRRRCHFSLRDNAPAIVSSLFPFLDPMARRVRLVGSGRRDGRLRRLFLEGLYFKLVMLAQIPARLEAAFHRGGTVTVYATWEG
ncbi:MAG: hypothetical protein Kow00109_18200 [Acidobacteriota bacterium]